MFRLKWILVLVTTILISVIAISCTKKKDDNTGILALIGLASRSSSSSSSSSLASSPEANVANDNKAQGIYKGVIVGSSGTFKIDYDNSGSGSTAPVFSYTYTPTGGTSTSGSITGTATVSGGVHTLTFTQSPYVLTMVLSSTGTIISATLAISGNPVVLTLYKETSASLVRMFEGTITGTTNSSLNSSAISAVWNLTTNGESSVSAHTKTISTGGVTCSTNCDQDFINVALDSTTKKLSGNGNTVICVIGANCSCQTATASNEAFLLATNKMTGTWRTTLTASCVTGTALGTLASGFEVASGTWTGTRTR